MAKQAQPSPEAIITTAAKRLYRESAEFKESNTPWNEVSTKKRDRYREEAKKLVKAQAATT